jgi:hypothetical protein
LTWLYGTVGFAEQVLFKDFRLNNYVVEDYSRGGGGKMNKDGMLVREAGNESRDDLHLYYHVIIT